MKRLLLIILALCLAAVTMTGCLPLPPLPGPPPGLPVPPHPVDVSQPLSKTRHAAATIDRALRQLIHLLRAATRSICARRSGSARNPRDRLGKQPLPAS